MQLGKATTYTTQAYLARMDEYLQTVGSHVDIWEIGNEINGEWLGDTATVAAKMSGAYDKAVAANRTTALKPITIRAATTKPITRCSPGRRPTCLRA